MFYFSILRWLNAWKGSAEEYRKKFNVETIRALVYIRAVGARRERRSLGPTPSAKRVDIYIIIYMFGKRFKMRECGISMHSRYMYIHKMSSSKFPCIYIYVWVYIFFLYIAHYALFVCVDCGCSADKARRLSVEIDSPAYAAE